MSNRSHILKKCALYGSALGGARGANNPLLVDRAHWDFKNIAERMTQAYRFDCKTLTQLQKEMLWIVHV